MTGFVGLRAVLEGLPDFSADLMDLMEVITRDPHSAIDKAEVICFIRRPDVFYPQSVNLKNLYVRSWITSIG